MRRITNCKNMSREELLIALLKSNQSRVELYKSKSDNAEIEETWKFFCEIRNKRSKSAVKEIRKDLYEKEKGLENEEEQERRQHAEGLNMFKNFLEGLREEIKKNYYKQIETKGAFNNNYIEYESRGDKDKNLSPEDYLDIIRPFLRDMINNHKTHGECKIQLTMQITFISSLGTREFRIMHSKSDNAEIMSGIETDDIINELFESFLRRYHEKLETKIRGSEFVFESVDLLYYSLHKISLNRGGSCIDSPDWIKHKKATINPKSKDNKCFRDAITPALNHRKINNYPERISNLTPFFDQYNWKDIEFPLHSKDWKKFEQNNRTIDLNILFV